MTAKEQQRMRRLEIENAELREKITNHMRVYGQMLTEICEMRASGCCSASVRRSPSTQTTR